VTKAIIPILLAIFLPAACLPQEVIYHVFERSFFDGNGDRQGDLPGLREKLDYLRQLGVTSVLLTPLSSRHSTTTISRMTGRRSIPITVRSGTSPTSQEACTPAG